MFNYNVYQIAWAAIWLAIIGVCAFAMWKGGRPERIGGALLLAVAIIGTIIEYTLQHPARGIAHLVNDAFLAIGFLVVALRYASFWLGGAMILQAVQFSLHSYYFVTERPRDLIYVWVNNLDTIGILALLAAGTIISWRQVQAARKAAT